jgi:hypothetical protein
MTNDVLMRASVDENAIGLAQLTGALLRNEVSIVTRREFT